MNSVSSIQTYKELGVTRSYVSWLSSHIWQLSQDNIPYFDTYFKMHWTPGYTLHKIKQGIIEHDGTSYHIEFSRGTTRGEILKLAQQGNKTHNVMLSFRKPNKIFNLPAYVLIQISKTQGI